MAYAMGEVSVMDRVLFDTWAGLARVVVVGVPAYAGLILLLRISGKRTLSKMNAFDLIVTVALGSTLATVLLSRNVALAEGLLALALLIALQFVIAWLSVRSATVNRLVKAEPTLVFHRGRFLHGALRRERVTEGEVRAAARAQGLGALDEIAAVVLETDGSFSVVASAPDAGRSTLGTVAGAGDD